MKLLFLNQASIFYLVNGLSDLQVEDNLFLLNKRPHDLAGHQFTCFEFWQSPWGCDSFTRQIIFVQQKKKVGIFHANLSKSTSSLYFDKIKKYIMILYQKKRKKRGS